MKTLKKIVLAVAIIIVLICLIQFIGIQKYDKYSYEQTYSITESKLYNTFIAVYKVNEISGSVKDSLMKYNLVDQFNQYEIWGEKHFTANQKYLFFFPIEYSQGEYLSTKNMQMCDEALEDSIFKTKTPIVALMPETVNPNDYRALHIDHSFETNLYDEIKAKVVFYWIKASPLKITPQFIGYVYLSKTESRDIVEKENESLLSSFKLFPFLSNTKKCACCQ